MSSNRRTNRTKKGGDSFSVACDASGCGICSKWRDLDGAMLTRVRLVPLRDEVDDLDVTALSNLHARAGVPAALVAAGVLADLAGHRVPGRSGRVVRRGARTGGQGS